MRDANEVKCLLRFGVVALAIDQIVRFAGFTTAPAPPSRPPLEAPKITPRARAPYARRSKDPRSYLGAS